MKREEKGEERIRGKEGEESKKYQEVKQGQGVKDKRGKDKLREGRCNLDENSLSLSSRKEKIWSDNTKLFPWDYYSLHK